MSRHSQQPDDTTSPLVPGGVSGAPVPGRGLGRIQIGTPTSLGPTSTGRLVALAAAAAPAGSLDPVDVALVEETRAYYDEEPMPAVVAESFEPAVPTRRYSVTRVRELRYPDGLEADQLFIMRGDLRAVVGAGSHFRGLDSSLTLFN